MLAGLVVSALLGLGPPLPMAACARKRVDACGCHHVYGLRHCHPNRKSKHRELTVKGKPTLKGPKNAAKSL
jgi:hypothetical protein